MSIIPNWFEPQVHGLDLLLGVDASLVMNKQVKLINVILHGYPRPDNPMGKIKKIYDADGRYWQEA